MLNRGGLESFRSEKTALYDDISRIEGKAAGEGIGTLLSDKQMAELAEWQRLWDAEEILFPDIPSWDYGKTMPSTVSKRPTPR